jgi:GTP-binding protein EngB required for normal cell division
MADAAAATAEAMKSVPEAKGNNVKVICLGDSAVGKSK